MWKIIVFFTARGDENISSPSDIFEIESNNATTYDDAGIQAKEHEPTPINISEGKPNNEQIKPKLSWFHHIKKTNELSKQALQRLWQGCSIEENPMQQNKLVYSDAISDNGHSHLQTIFHVWVGE